MTCVTINAFPGVAVVIDQNGQLELSVPDQTFVTINREPDFPGFSVERDETGGIVLNVSEGADVTLVTNWDFQTMWRKS